VGWLLGWLAVDGGKVKEEEEEEEEEEETAAEAKKTKKVEKGLLN
jgi:hypothetical protein